MTDRKLDCQKAVKKLTMKVLATDIERVLTIVEALETRQRREMDLVFEELQSIYSKLVTLAVLLAAVAFTLLLTVII